MPLRDSCCELFTVTSRLLFFGMLVLIGYSSLFSILLGNEIKDLKPPSFGPNNRLDIQIDQEALRELQGTAAGRRIAEIIIKSLNERRRV